MFLNPEISLIIKTPLSINEDAVSKFLLSNDNFKFSWPTSKLSKNNFKRLISSSDVILFAKGLAIGKKFDVQIFEPNVNIKAIQGPKSFKLMEKVLEEKIKKKKKINYKYIIHFKL